LHGSIQHVIDFPGDGGVTAGESWWSYSNFRHRCVAYSTCRSQLTTINGLPRPFIKTPQHVVVKGFKWWHPSVCLSSACLSHSWFEQNSEVLYSRWRTDAILEIVV